LDDAIPGDQVAMTQYRKEKIKKIAKTIMIKSLFRFIGVAILFILGLVVVLCASWYRKEIPAKELESNYLTPQSSYITVNGANIHVRQQGKGTPIFLLHGSFASLHTWDAWERELSKHYKTISFDFPGHGLTGPVASQKYSTDDYERLVIRLADQLQIDTFLVAGNSMGGLVAWKLALHHPTRVKKLVLVDAAGYWKISAYSSSKKQSRPFIFKLLKSDVIAKVMIKITPRFLFKMYLKEVYGDPTKVKEEDVDRFYDLMLREGNRASTMQRLRQPGSDLQDSIRYISTPTLIIWGEKDAWIPVSNAYRFKEDIKGAELKVFEGTGHMPMEEIPLETVSVALQFLQNKPG
jgi:pimeloyl-ACP methyl ester carboxylesterase